MNEEEILKYPEVPTNIFDPIDFTIFKDEIQDNFQTLSANTCPEEKDKKALVISKYLSPKFSYIFKMQDLIKCGFSSTIYYLENCPQSIKENQLVFVIPSRIECIDIVVKQILKDQQDIEEKQRNFKQNKASIVEKTYFYYYVPKADISILNYIEEKYCLYSSYLSRHFDFELLNFPLDFDLISLEDSQCFKELYLYNFSDCIDNLANLLIKIQEIFGKIKNKYIIGENAKILSQLLSKKEKEGFLSEKNSNEILACIYFDRSVDYITPFCTEYTYEALLHAYFDIKFNRIKVKKEIINEDEEVKPKNIINDKDSKSNIIKESDKKEDEKKPEDEYKTIFLDMDDKFYYMIKNFNFNKIRIFLSKRLKYQQEHLMSGKNNKDFKSLNKDIELIKEIKEERNSLSNHINLADYISKKIATPRSKRRLQLEQMLLNCDKECLDLLHEYYETEMARKGDPYELLKLFCLENLIFGGVKNKIYDSFKNDFLMTYDERLFFLFENLEELKILRKGENSKLYKTCLDKLNLLNYNVDIIHPNDTSYVFGGYSPISIRLIEKAINPGWNSLLKDVLKNFGCEYYFPEDESKIINPIFEQNYILLVFIGGITYSEIAAIRYLNKSPDYKKYKFLIITTNVISGKNFFDEIKSNKIEPMLDLNDIIKKPKEREEKIDDKKLKKMKENEEKEKKKKEKEEKEKQKELEERKKELEKDRAEYKEKKKKEKDNK